MFASYFELNHIYHQQSRFFNVVNKLSQLEQHCLIKLLKKKEAKEQILCSCGQKNPAEPADKDTERYQWQIWLIRWWNFGGVLHNGF